MIEESLLKSNYLGKDGFIWWIGQVANPESWRTETTDIDGENSWGYRCKVRIIGYHTFDGTVLPDEDLPYAHIMLDPAFGSGQGGLGKRHNIVGGETVFGFFLDGEDAQQPVVVGLIYRTNDTEDLISKSAINADKSSGFKPFRGDIGHMEMKPIQRRELPKKEVSTPQPSQPKTSITNIAFNNESFISSTIPDRPPGRDQIVTNDSAFQSAWKSAYEFAKTTGENGCENNLIGQITRAINDFLSVINGLQKTVNGFIDPITNVVVDVSNIIRNTTTQILGMVKSIVNNMRSTVIKLITKLFREFIALLVPIPQQSPVAEATRNILDIIFCLFERILDLLASFLGNLIGGLIGNTLSASTCQAEEFVAVLSGKILDFVDDLLSPIMSGLSWLTGGIGQLGSILSQASSVANQILNLIGCDGLKCKTPSEWSLAFGMSGAAPDNWGNVFGKLDTLKGINSNIDNAAGFISLYTGPSSFSSCNEVITQNNISPPPYGTKYDFCIPPIVNLYGGGGVSASAVPIVSSTGKILSVEVLNGGFGYITPPTVNIVDKTGHGSGATASAIVENGAITGFYITNTGSGYCQGNYNDLQSEPYYITTADNYSIIEGQSVNFTIKGFNAPETSNFKYVISGDVNQDDIIQPLNGSIILTNGNGSITIETKADSQNEGSELMIFDLFDDFNNNICRVYIIVSDFGSSFIPPNNIPVQSPVGTDVPIGTIQNDNSILPGIATSIIPDTGVPTETLTTPEGSPAIIPTDQLTITPEDLGQLVPEILDTGDVGPGVEATFVEEGTSQITDILGDPSSNLSNNPLVELDKLVVISPGNNYSTEDNIIVGTGITFDLFVDANTGSIIDFKNKTGNQYYIDPPNLQINTQDGEGALVYPVFKLRKQYNTRPLVINRGGILEVIDCV